MTKDEAIALIEEAEKAGRPLKVLYTSPKGIQQLAEDISRDAWIIKEHFEDGHKYCCLSILGVSVVPVTDAWWERFVKGETSDK